MNNTNSSFHVESAETSSHVASLQILPIVRIEKIKVLSKLERKTIDIMRILLFILAFCSSINLFAQKIKGKDLGWEAARDFSIVEMERFRSLFQTDSLMTNLKFLGEPTFLERDPYSDFGGFGFEVHFEGLEIDYVWSTDFKKGVYKYTRILVNSPIYTLEFRGDRVKVGQSIDTLPESLTAPEIEHTESQDRMLFHFSPVSNSFQIIFDKKSRLITAFEFSNIFY